MKRSQRGWLRSTFGLVIQGFLLIWNKSQRSSSRRVRSPRRRRLTLLPFFWVFLAILAASIFNAKVFRIQQTEIVWDKEEFRDDRLLADLNGATLGQNIFWMADRNLEKYYEPYLAVADHSLEKIYPRSLRFRVFTRDPFLELVTYLKFPQEEASPSFWRAFDNEEAYNQGSQSGTFLVDRQGYVFAKSFGKNSARVRVFVPETEPIELGQFLVSRPLSVILRLIPQLVSFGGDWTVSYLILSPEPALVVIKLEDGPFVFLPLEDSDNRKVDALRLIVNKYKIEGRHLQTVDLRFKNPVVEY